MEFLAVLYYDSKWIALRCYVTGDFGGLKSLISNNIIVGKDNAVVESYSTVGPRAAHCDVVKWREAVVHTLPPLLLMLKKNLSSLS
jgi:hypothetical protein